jgi:hypothetical protein
VRIKLDENLPSRLVSALQARGHDVDTLASELTAGTDDAHVWTACQTTGRFLITQDLDFSDVRRYAPGTHRGLLLVLLTRPGPTRCSNASTRCSQRNTWGLGRLSGTCDGAEGADQ